jgi:hypothetical protein
MVPIIVARITGYAALRLLHPLLCRVVGALLANLPLIVLFVVANKQLVTEIMQGLVKV